MPATGAAAAIRSAYLHATAEVMNAPFDSPVTKTRCWSTQTVRSTSSSRSPMNFTSADRRPVSQRATASPLPWGVTVTNPCASPNGPSADICWWTVAPSA